MFNSVPQVSTKLVWIHSTTNGICLYEKANVTKKILQYSTVQRERVPITARPAMFKPRKKERKRVIRRVSTAEDSSEEEKSTTVISSTTNNTTSQDNDNEDGFNSDASVGTLPMSGPTAAPAPAPASAPTPTAVADSSNSNNPRPKKMRKKVKGSSKTGVERGGAAKPVLSFGHEDEEVEGLGGGSGGGAGDGGGGAFRVKKSKASKVRIVVLEYGVWWIDLFCVLARWCRFDWGGMR